MDERRKTGVYVKCTYHPETCLDLAAWSSEHLPSEPLDPLHYHTTILYSRAPVADIENLIAGMRTDVHFKLKGIKLLPNSDDSTRAALVVVLDAPELVDYHRRLLAAGGTHDWDDYIPHITLSYQAPVDLDVMRITIPAFDFEVDTITFEPLDLNWKV